MTAALPRRRKLYYKMTYIKLIETLFLSFATRLMKLGSITFAKLVMHFNPILDGGGKFAPKQFFLNNSLTTEQMKF